MKEIPLIYVRANQWGLVLTILASVIFNQPSIAVIVFLIQFTGLVWGLKFNIFIQFARIFQLDRFRSDKTEAAELQRFNNSIAVVLLAISSILFLLSLDSIGFSFQFGLVVASKIVALMVAFAAFLAICGYCIGCKIYYRFKRITLR